MEKKEEELESTKGEGEEGREGERERRKSGRIE